MRVPGDENDMNSSSEGTVPYVKRRNDVKMLFKRVPFLVWGGGIRFSEG